MLVITLSRQMGSGGDEVAVAVAAALNLRLVGRKLVNEAAKRAGVPEVALAEIDELDLLEVRPRPAALRLYRETADRLIREQAAAGDVLVVGRGGQVVLGNQPGVLHVRLNAPIAMRINRVQAGCGIPAGSAAALVNSSDKARAGYLRRHYHADVNAPDLYDLILNMAHFTVAAAADIVCLAAQQRTAL